MKRRLATVLGRTTFSIASVNCGGCTGSPIIENAVARSLLSEVVVAFSLPSKVRAQAARASSVCGEAMALVRGKSKLFLY